MMENFFEWRIAHYTQRLAEEKEKKNWKAVRFFKAELDNLNKKP